MEIAPAIASGSNPLAVLTGRPRSTSWKILGAGSTADEPLRWFDAGGAEVTVPLVPLLFPESGPDLILAVFERSALSLTALPRDAVARARTVTHIVGDDITMTADGRIKVWFGMALEY